MGARMKGEKRRTGAELAVQWKHRGRGR